MKMNVHLNFKGNAAEAFAFYEQVFGTKIVVKMTYADAPASAMPEPPSDDIKDRILHVSLPLGEGLLMGCDAPEGRSTPMGGFQVNLLLEDKDEVARIYEALKDGGSVQMPLMPTFWSPLFGMCTDKFGVAWMVGMPGDEPARSA